MTPVALSDIKDSSGLTQALDSTKLAVLMFTAGWCGPCKRIKSAISNDTESDIAREYSDRVIFYYIDIDKNPDLASEFSIKGIPVFYFVSTRSGVIEFLADSISGAQTQPLINAIEKGLTKLGLHTQF